MGKSSYRNDMVAVHLIKSYCLPSMLYGCEIWSINRSDIILFYVLYYYRLRYCTFMYAFLLIFVLSVRCCYGVSINDDDNTVSGKM